MDSMKQHRGSFSKGSSGHAQGLQAGHARENVRRRHREPRHVLLLKRQKPGRKRSRSRKKNPLPLHSGKIALSILKEVFVREKQGYGKDYRTLPAMCPEEAGRLIRLDLLSESPEFWKKTDHPGTPLGRIPKQEKSVPEKGLQESRKQSTRESG
jgi:hypothetical protein